uniref:Grctm5 protein n=1 Tax=Biomphalaria glabrata TaxID=6526 RepID=A0A0C9S0H4_BIOGL
MDIVFLCLLIFVSTTLHSADLFVSYVIECTSNTTCIVDTVCLPGVDNIKRCRCEENKFRTSKNKCNFISDLRVYNVKLDKVTPTSVKWNWTSDYTQGLAAVYNVSYNNSYQLGDENGVTVDNLRPDTLYTFTMKVIISDKHLANQPTYGPSITLNVWTSASLTSTTPMVTMETITSTLSTSSSELKSTRTTPDIEMSMTLCRDSISLKVFLLVTISLCSLLAAAIVIIVILMRSKWRRKKRNENVYDTTKKCDLETHQYCDTTNLNKSEYQEVSDLTFKLYSNQ